MVVVENTPERHNLIVCTLCTCYPWLVLSLPRVWYKSAPYRSRAVIDPRNVLSEFGGSWQKIMKYGFGIQLRRSAILSCPCGPAAPTIGTKPGLLSL